MLAADFQGVSMASDQFAERLAQVRARFASKLETRIASLDEAAPLLRGDGATAIETLAVAHRGIHDLCGVGPTIGFDATGRAARDIERVLLVPLRAGRGLNESEAAALREGIGALRAAARDDLQAHSVGAE
jgi:hypothetical protein